MKDPVILNQEEVIPFELERTSNLVANNLALIFADQVKKGLLPWNKVPLLLRSAVQELLSRGE